ncbi:SDR family NAD(P)-dependent oxidoreductase [Flocculibacter collagenilyticus]|uniref:SDR family NAD(P)-dependent oxidoreductase n=1 Tax=Flocculibacter collagenilyticus TaxID=2744479 RepID=UPI0018F38404|nr:SDR family NAD(P)-dependent oxidoreductase [Flocculibacter collagenilyticus]
MQNILITGATSGIGEALAANYIANGHRVFGCGRNEEKLNALALEHAQNGSSNFIPLAFDATDLSACHQAAESVMQSLGGSSNNDAKLDKVILNAGGCEYIEPLQFKSAPFEKMMTTNVLTMTNCIEAFATFLSAGSQLAIMGSSVTLLPIAKAEAYGASKAALSYLANTLRLSWEEKNIAVSLIEPGFVKTPLTDNNNFDMPFCISAEEAAERIAKGLAERQSTIRFPKRLIASLKILSWLPGSISHKLLNRNNE